jgi:hypothetical protein
MKINILEIYYKNIREMKELVIDLTGPDGPSPISLIQMPNGVGKTTTMELIRYCLDKGAEELDEKKILSFKPPRTEVKNGEFRIKLSVDGQTRLVTIRFDYENPSVKYLTTTTEKGGVVDGLELGQEIAPWLRDRNFVRLFVFDGELAGELLSSESTSAEEAINSLYHLDNLRDLYVPNGTIDRISLERMTGISTDVQTDQGKKALTTKLRKALSCQKELSKTKASHERKLSNLRSQINKANEKRDLLREQDERLIKQYEKLQGQDQVLENKIVETTDRLLKAMRVPNNLSEEISSRLGLLASQMGKLKLPKTQSKEFFEELSECPECICGRPIGKKESQTIKKKAQDFLTEDNIGEINAIKTSIKSLPERENIGALVEGIKKLNRERKMNERELLKLDRQTKSREIIAKLNERIAKLDIKESEEASLLAVLNENRKEEQEALGLTWDVNIDMCAKKIIEWQHQLAEATNTVDFMNKANVLKNILEQINEESLVRLKKNILTKTNKRIEEILGSKDIAISEIGSCLSLSDRTGVSEGQKLSIAYAFLSTLFHESPNELPFIVDTPAAPLDLKVRREVAKILPSLFGQIVVFITSGERDGFADRYYARKKSDCLFLTVRKVKNNVCLEEDLDFFKNFQSED